MVDADTFYGRGKFEKKFFVCASRSGILIDFCRMPLSDILWLTGICTDGSDPVRDACL